MRSTFRVLGTFGSPNFTDGDRPGSAPGSGPVLNIGRAFEEIQQKAVEDGVAEVVGNFLSYVEIQWLQRTGPHNFSVHKAPKRTNNASDGVNNALQKAIGKRQKLPVFLRKL